MVSQWAWSLCQPPQTQTKWDGLWALISGGVRLEPLYNPSIHPSTYLVTVYLRTQNNKQAGPTISPSAGVLIFFWRGVALVSISWISCRVMQLAVYGKHPTQRSSDLKMVPLLFFQVDTDSCCALMSPEGLIQLPQPLCTIVPDQPACPTSIFQLLNPQVLDAGSNLHSVRRKKTYTHSVGSGVKPLTLFVWGPPTELPCWHHVDYPEFYLLCVSVNEM